MIKIIYLYFINILRYFWIPILAASIATFTFINRDQFQNEIVEHRVIFSDPIFGGKAYNNYYHKDGHVRFQTSSEKFDVIREEKTNNANIIQWIIFGVSLAIILVWSIYFGTEGSDIISNLEKRITFGLSTVEVDDSGGDKYVCLGRVVGSRDPSRSYLMTPDWKEFPKISSIKFLPKFHSKNQNRISNLNKIGV